MNKQEQRKFSIEVKFLKIRELFLTEIDLPKVAEIINSNEKLHKLYLKAMRYHDKKHSFYNGEKTKGFWVYDNKKYIVEEQLRLELEYMGYYYEDSFCYA